MSKRLQVLLSDAEMDDLQKFARREGVPLGTWVRQVLREARSRQPARGPETKLKAVREAVQYSFPTADIEQMLSEIEKGYRE